MDVNENLNKLVASVVREEIENFKVPSQMKKDLEGPLPTPHDTEEKNLQKAIRAIEAEGYDYEMRGKNTILIKDDDRIETLEKMKSMLIPQGFRHNPIGGGSSIGRLEILDKVLGSVYILIKPKSRRAAASAGVDFEDKMAQLINDKYGAIGVKATTAGFGHGSDLTIKTPMKTITAELKTALSADFGQFRAQFNQATSAWEPRRTPGYVKNEEIFNPLFEQYLNDWLDANATFPDPYDDRLRKDGGKITGLQRTEGTGELKRKLENEWFDGKTDYKIAFPFEMIASYYADKGDEYIQINGRGLYALTSKASKKLGVAMFKDLGLISYLRFRFKPSHGVNSATSFTVAVKLKGKYKDSNLSLTNAEDLDIIINKLL
jgi:hypothetical protein